MKKAQKKPPMLTRHGRQAVQLRGRPNPRNGTTENRKERKNKMDVEKIFLTRSNLSTEQLNNSIAADAIKERREHESRKQLNRGNTVGRAARCPKCGGHGQSVKETFYGWGVIPAATFYYYECCKCHHRGPRFEVQRKDFLGDYKTPCEAKRLAFKAWNDEAEAATATHATDNQGDK